jgi:hypothetical protein
MDIIRLSHRCLAVSTLTCNDTSESVVRESDADTSDTTVMMMNKAMTRIETSRKDVKVREEQPGHGVAPAYQAFVSSLIER